MCDCWTQAHHGAEAADGTGWGQAALNLTGSREALYSNHGDSTDFLLRIHNFHTDPSCQVPSTPRRPSKAAIQSSQWSRWTNESSAQVMQCILQQPGTYVIVLLNFQGVGDDFLWCTPLYFTPLQCDPRNTSSDKPWCRRGLRNISCSVTNHLLAVPTAQRQRRRERNVKLKLN